MTQPTDYIATWFYKESEDEASFYPQMGQKGSSELVHSIYMQIQIPFFVTFKHYNPQARLLFFTNLTQESLPSYLLDVFSELEVEVITRAYTCRPPKDWYPAWQNQFYLYDILLEMEHRMQPEDTLLISDADCLCHKPLQELFDHVRRRGSALYEFITDPAQLINGITTSQLDDFYTACYGSGPHTPMAYYGGEFIALRTDKIRALNKAFPSLWQFNLERAAHHLPRLNEEAHALSILAERLDMRNRSANTYIKRMWTSPHFNNVQQDDRHLAVWHLPYEKKRGLFRLYRWLAGHHYRIEDEKLFWHTAGLYTGIPVVTCRKKIYDRLITGWMKLKQTLS